MTNRVSELKKLGQSLWFDQMERSLITTGELRRMIEAGEVLGLTSNPTIFQKAITGSDAYDDTIQRLAREDKSAAEINQALMLQDIAAAADLFLPVYEAAKGGDGFVSIEVSPELAFDAEATMNEARKLHRELHRTNVLVKVPATKEGLGAIEQLTSEGINVNVTLIFSVERYREVTKAYIRGLERRIAEGKPIDHAASVASFFVSRIDVSTEKRLQKVLDDPARAQQHAAARELFGKAAIANAKLAYEAFKEIFHGKRFAELRKLNARVQRPLWASTGTKNPKYSDVYYVDSLIGSETVNTVPPQTLKAFLDHGEVTPTLEAGLADAKRVFEQLKSLGIDFKEITDELTQEGVKAFADSFRSLLAAVEEERKKFAATGARRSDSTGDVKSAIDAALRRAGDNNLPKRIWSKDATTWKSDPEHQKIIGNALGWLDVAKLLLMNAEDLKAFAAEIRREGFEYAVVLGMGGSSLCPEVFARSFGNLAGYPRLYVLDSTVVGAVRALEQKIQVEKTLFIVASKSGTTTEPRMFHRYFYARVKEKLGDKAGRNFVAITDPDTQLVADARQDNFRRVFLNPADIGGRYSALSFFGMVPFAVMGGDVRVLLERAERMVQACGASVPAQDNPAVRLGAMLAGCARQGRDKLTLIASEPVASVGLWIEQLVAESTGKEGKGILPVAGEPLGQPENYDNDRVFAYIHVVADPAIEGKLKRLEGVGHPVIRHKLESPLDLGAEFYLWEFATAVAGALLGIDAFDQPNVQESKDNTRRLLAQFDKDGALPENVPGVTRISLANGVGAEQEKALEAFVQQVRPHDYISIQQYLPENAETDARIQRLQVALRNALRVAVTTGYGPRFLHSTGQFHKGGPATGVFLQITATHPNKPTAGLSGTPAVEAGELPIPGEKAGFAVLADAQALGDLLSLAQHKRRVLAVRLGANVLNDLDTLARNLQRLVEAKAVSI
jgi:transaldolase/glucose-6-phosphate isomerase